MLRPIPSVPKLFLLRSRTCLNGFSGVEALPRLRLTPLLYQLPRVVKVFTILLTGLRQPVSHGSLEFCPQNVAPWETSCLAPVRLMILLKSLRKCYTYPEGLQGFYKQLYYEWQRVYNIIPSNDLACRSEPLWHKKNISMGFLGKNREQWLEIGVCRVNDILYRGKIMTPYRFRQKINMVLHHLPRFLTD